MNPVSSVTVDRGQLFCAPSCSMLNLHVDREELGLVTVACVVALGVTIGWLCHIDLWCLTSGAWVLRGEGQVYPGRVMLLVQLAIRDAFRQLVLIRRTAGVSMKPSGGGFGGCLSECSIVGRTL